MTAGIPGDTPRLPLGPPKRKARGVKHKTAPKPTQIAKSGDVKRTARALARARYEAGVSGEALVADTCQTLDSVRVGGRIPMEEWRRALQILLDEADDHLAERCPSWVEDPGCDSSWTGNPHGLRDN